MVRNLASYVLGFVAIAALGVAMAGACAMEPPGDLAAITVPCEPAAPGFQAAPGESALTRIDSTARAEARFTPAGLVWIARLEDAANPAPVPAPHSFPPLLHRPPPAAS